MTEMKVAADMLYLSDDDDADDKRVIERMTPLHLSSPYDVFTVWPVKATVFGSENVKRGEIASAEEEEEEEGTLLSFPPAGYRISRNDPLPRN